MPHGDDVDEKIQKFGQLTATIEQGKTALEGGHAKQIPQSADQSNKLPRSSPNQNETSLRKCPMDAVSISARIGVISIDIYQSVKAIGAIENGKRKNLSAISTIAIIAISIVNQPPLIQW